MTLDPFVALPAVAVAALTYMASAEVAFLWVYLPVLLLLPDSFIWGWPPLNPHQYAILPIGLVLSWRAIKGKWRGSWTDILVFGFLAWMLASDMHANGTTDIVNRLITPLTLAAFPYIVGKLVIEQEGLRVAVAKRFVFLLFIDAIICVYEFRFAVNPVRQLLAPFFSSVDQWHTQVRYGFGRAAGPFGHAIFMGSIVAIAIILHRYVTYFGWWEKRFRWFPNVQLNKPLVMLCGLIAGSVMTLSRGPWLAAIVGGVVASIGIARNRWRALRFMVVILLAGAALVYFGGKAYVADGKSYESKEEVASAEYRAELVHEYRHIAMVQSFWGWGSPNWPKVPGMVSIDNWYLLVTLMYGVTGLVLFVAMLGAPIVQLLWIGMLENDLDGDLRGMLFTLSGIIAAIAVAVGTVFLGGQLFPLLFLFLGWSDACLVYRPRRLSAVPVFAFRKVII